MSSGFKVYDSAKKLPDTWDKIAEKHIFIKKDFLIFLESVNYCRQNYHINEKESIIMVSYKLKLNLLTFSSRFKLNFTITIIGIPLSIACTGFVCGKDGLKILSSYLKQFPLVLILNTEGELPIPKAYTLSSYSMELKKDFYSLFNSLKSRYRRRLKIALSKLDNLKITKLYKKDFSKEHYDLYEQVYERSEGKLEKLSIEFFKNMDAEIYQIHGKNGILLAFFQIKQVDRELIFMFCGVDRENNIKYDTYLNMLIYILKLAYAGHCRRLHLGQTCGYSKSRLGAEKDEKYMHLASCIIPDFICKILLNILGKRREE